MLEKLLNKDTEEYRNHLRQKREPLLQAFDIHKTNVFYGICIETEEEHNEILKWYYDLLDLKETAINNVPQHIQRHL
jgi:hypothetical protein